MRVLFKNLLPVGVTHECPVNHPSLLKDLGVEFDSFQQRWNWKSLDEVQLLALRLSSISSTRASYIGVDYGSGCSPRFDIVELPKVGDLVSKSFNGDSYPCGVITKITRKFTVTTSTNHVFRRRGESANWKLTGGTWSLISGHHDDRNPSF